VHRSAMARMPFGRVIDRVNMMATTQQKRDVAMLEVAFSSDGADSRSAERIMRSAGRPPRPPRRREADRHLGGTVREGGSRSRRRAGTRLVASGTPKRWVVTTRTPRELHRRRRVTARARGDRGPSQERAPRRALPMTGRGSRSAPSVAGYMEEHAEVLVDSHDASRDHDRVMRGAARACARMRWSACAIGGDERSCAARRNADKIAWSMCMASGRSRALVGAATRSRPEAGEGPSLSAVESSASSMPCANSADRA